MIAVSFGHVVSISESGRVEWSNNVSQYINPGHVDYQFTGPDAAALAAAYHAQVVRDGRDDALLNPVKGKKNLVRVPRND